MPISLDKLTLHNDDYRQVGWFDMLQGDPPKGSIAVIVINDDAVQQRENVLMAERIFRSRGL